MEQVWLDQSAYPDSPSRKPVDVCKTLIMKAWRPFWRALYLSLIIILTFFTHQLQ